MVSHSIKGHTASGLNVICVVSLLGATSSLAVMSRLSLLLLVSLAVVLSTASARSTPEPNSTEAPAATVESTTKALCHARCVSEQFCRDVKSGRLADDTCAFNPSACTPRVCQAEEVCCV